MHQKQMTRLPRDEIRRDYPGFQNARTSVGDVSQIKASIEEGGLRTPPLVWRFEDENGDVQHVLIGGYRRMEAVAQLVDEVDGADEAFKEILCSVFEGDLDNALAVNLNECLEGVDLNVVDEAEAVERLLVRLGTSGGQVRVGAMINRSQAWVSGRVALVRSLVPEVLTALRLGADHVGGINLKQAKAIALFVDSNGRPERDKQLAALERLLGTAQPAVKDENAEPPLKKPRVIKNKKDFGELMARFLSNEDLDQGHRVSSVTVLRWCLGELSDEDVLHPQPINIATDAAQGDEQQAPAADAVPEVKAKSRKDAVQVAAPAPVEKKATAKTVEKPVEKKADKAAKAAEPAVTETKKGKKTIETDVAPAVAESIGKPVGKKTAAKVEVIAKPEKKVAATKTEKKFVAAGA